MIDYDDPFRFDSAEEIEKENKELTRALNTIRKYSKRSSTKDSLRERDLTALEKGGVALAELISKRKKVVTQKHRDAKTKEHKVRIGVRLLKDVFGDIDHVLKIKIALATRVYTNFYSIGDIDREFKNTFETMAGILPSDIPTRDEALKMVKEFNDAITDKSKKGYDYFQEKLAETIKWYEKEIEK